MKKLLVIVLSSVLFGFGVYAEALKGTGEASFSVKATGHTVHGTVALEPFEVNVKEVDGDKLLSFKATCEVYKMTTNKKKRDKEMYEHLQAEEHPAILGEAKNISLAAISAKGEEAITFPFSFEMSGVQVEKTAEVLAVEETDEGITLKVGFEVSQIEHFLTLIKKMGFLKVKDTVHVEVSFTMAP